MVADRGLEVIPRSLPPLAVLVPPSGPPEELASPSLTKLGLAGVAAPVCGVAAAEALQAQGCRMEADKDESRHPVAGELAAERLHEDEIVQVRLVAAAEGPVLEVISKAQRSADGYPTQTPYRQQASTMEPRLLGTVATCQHGDAQPVLQKAQTATTWSPTGEDHTPCGTRSSEAPAKFLQLPLAALSQEGQSDRVPLPILVSAADEASDPSLVPAAPPPVAPSAALAEAASGWRVDWAAVQRMARRIADPVYSLQKFHEDMLSFPELGLYLLEGKSSLSPGAAISPTGPGTPTIASSGRTAGDEYQRTVGAFFAVYWLLRLPHDGRAGFCFGVDENWSPLRPEQFTGSADPPRSGSEKRLAFHDRSEWAYLEKLLFDAELVTGKNEDGSYQVDEQRVTALLALTAVHDVMKMEELLPEVQLQHAPYHGYAAGDVIGDHDHALSYLMDHYPALLPSFDGLGPEERASVHFTQCQLCFNHGWFVQAEAPPGAIFGKFREVLLRERLEPRDVAFYFVHWLTDLAGAEPTPLAGCEKFVTKFPLAVLNSFMRSFEYVQRLAHSSETEVMEAYLLTRWEEHMPPLGPRPIGPGAVARLRLACMAQTAASRVLDGYGRLSEPDQAVLSLEMARTGCRDQSFSPELVPTAAEGCDLSQGPALLIYYGPAFLQNSSQDDSCARLAILAEVYRQGRDLWPASPEAAGTHVTIRIDAIKALGIDQLRAATKSGGQWVVVKRNESEAFIERVCPEKLRILSEGNQPFRTLQLP